MKGHEGERISPQDRGRSALMLRDAHDKPVEILADAELAAQTAGGADFIGKVQHVLFHLRRLTRHCPPVFIHINMAGGAGARAPAFGDDAGHIMLDRRFHDRLADRPFHNILTAGVVDIGDLGHDEGGPDRIAGKRAEPALRPARQTGGSGPSGQTASSRRYKRIQSVTPALIGPFAGGESKHALDEPVGFRNLRFESG
jgi:hypothetical protein